MNEISGRNTIQCGAELLGQQLIMSHWLEKRFSNQESLGRCALLLIFESVIGLEQVVGELLATGADVKAQGGLYGNALQAALVEGHEKVVQILLDAGADVNAQGGTFGNALQAASVGGYEKVLQMLLDAGGSISN